MNNLMQQWGALWGSGMARIWQHYTQAQDSIREQGRALVGQTPAQVVYTEGRLRLLHYTPRTPSPLAVPLLCIPSLINQYYIMDLTPERSLVGALLDHGIDVYMLDWGAAAEGDRHRSFDEYITGLMRRAIGFVRQHSGQPAIALLGYCMGGMMSALYTALYPDEIASLINLAGPINYHDDGIYSVWTRAEWLDADLLVDTLGNIPGELLNTTFNLVRPTGIALQALDYWERRDDPAFLRRFAAMQLWTSDTSAFPGEAFRKYIKDCYQQNRLIAGRFTIHDRPIDLRRITTPALTIAARRDHIAPWESVAVFHDLIASPDKELLVLESGHIGMVVGSSASTQLWPRLGQWLAARSGPPRT
ncbi:MAG: alpha/beta fold hydrolase [Chloroflexi bacterium]|nr:alpha/beta fold hydrolase [Chloroflexota bacterium]